MDIEIVGWHLTDRDPCKDCGEPAHYVVAVKGDYDSFNLCKGCASHPWYTVTADKIEDVFKGLGL